jgi:hypothetical protein
MSGGFNCGLHWSGTDTVLREIQIDIAVSEISSFHEDKWKLLCSATLCRTVCWMFIYGPKNRDPSTFKAEIDLLPNLGYAC